MLPAPTWQVVVSFPVGSDVGARDVKVQLLERGLRLRVEVRAPGAGFELLMDDYLFRPVRSDGHCPCTSFLPSILPSFLTGIVTLLWCRCFIFSVVSVVKPRVSSVKPRVSGVKPETRARDTSQRHKPRVKARHVRACVHATDDGEQGDDAWTLVYLDGVRVLKIVLDKKKRLPQRGGPAQTDEGMLASAQSGGAQAARQGACAPAWLWPQLFHAHHSGAPVCGTEMVAGYVSSSSLQQVRLEAQVFLLACSRASSN